MQSNTRGVKRGENGGAETIVDTNGWLYVTFPRTTPVSLVMKKGMMTKRG